MKDFFDACSNNILVFILLLCAGGYIIDKIVEVIKKRKS